MPKGRSLSTLNRKIHHWGSIAIALPLVIVLVTGVLLLLKKDLDWIQPPTIKGEQKGLTLDFEQILAIARTAPEAGIETSADVDRIDVRPGKGMLKVRAESSWEIQIDANTGQILQLAYRRSDLIESIHDGSFFGDWHGDKPFIPTAQSLRADWAKLGAQPGFQTVRSRVPVLATWDNHDYGSHDGGAGFALKETARKELLDFFGEPDGSDRRRNPGIYTAQSLGPEGRRVQLILLDTKWFRSDFVKDQRSPEERQAIGKVGKYVPNEDDKATILGEEQWRWLDEQLRQPAEVRLIVSSTQIVADQKGMDEWGVFPQERERLFRLIRDTGAKGVLLISGNVHFAELSVWNDGSYPLYDLTSSGMTHVNPTYAAARNPHRVAGPFVEHNFGLLEIDWQAKPWPMLTLRALGEDGRAGFTHEISLGELQ